MISLVYPDILAFEVIAFQKQIHPIDVSESGKCEISRYVNQFIVLLVDLAEL